MDEFITILIVNYNSADFVINTLWCLERITKNPYKVIIADNNSRLSDYKKLERHCSNLPNVVLYRKEDFELKASMAHGTTLNELVKMVETPYFSILDADATWLAKNWDQRLIARMNNKIKVIGTQAPIGKPQDFPLMFAILFETTAFNALKIDFRPKDIQRMQDTGFEMRGKYMTANNDNVLLEVKNTRSYHEGPFSGLVGVGEYYLDGNFDEIFASHFGRGSSLGAPKYTHGFFCCLPVFGKYFRILQGVREKKEWLQRCRTIIDNNDKLI
ncbi:glycosyltransferase family 2 protein [Patescibacteria group bacterium]|nr:glycosyltransferase family 2 protein [Patescibacteria group bacterium]